MAFRLKIWLKIYEDIAGLRVMVQFVDDVDEVLALLRHRSDMTYCFRARLYPETVKFGLSLLSCYYLLSR